MAEKSETKETSAAIDASPDGAAPEATAAPKEKSEDTRKSPAAEGGGAKNAARPKTDPALAALRNAAKGLLFVSESDKPIKAFLWVGLDIPEGDINASVLTAAEKVPDGAKVTTRTVDEFFQNATANQDWFGEDEKKQAERFRALVATLKEQLTGVQVFRVESDGESRATAYVVGRTAAGNLAGVQTELIET